MIKTIAGLVFSLGGLYVAFRKIDIGSLGQVLSNVRGLWLLLAALLMVFSVWLRAVRWQILMAPIRKTGVASLFTATMIGYFGNAVLPLRLGEFLRAHAIHKRVESITVASAFGTIVVERLLDLMGAMVLTIVFFLLYDVPSWLEKSGIALGVVVIGSSSFLWWMTRSHERWLEKLENLAFLRSGIGTRVQRFLHSFVKGLIALRDADRLGALTLHTGLLWLIYWLTTQMSAYALRLSLTWIEVGVLLVATTMVISLPSAPGFIGTYHAAAVLMMTEIFGKSQTVSQAYALLNHAVGFVPLVTIGFIFMVRSSMRLKEIKRLELEE
ncbi:MAG: lysylphosphatidylglycerol synthase transmembrane domain-containing protein [Fidelibacterota bacterium]